MVCPGVLQMLVQARDAALQQVRAKTEENGELQSELSKVRAARQTESQVYVTTAPYPAGLLLLIHYVCIGPDGLPVHMVEVFPGQLHVLLGKLGQPTMNTWSDGRHPWVSNELHCVSVCKPWRSIFKQHAYLSWLRTPKPLTDQPEDTNAPVCHLVQQFTAVVHNVSAMSDLSMRLLCWPRQCTCEATSHSNSAGVLANPDQPVLGQHKKVVCSWQKCQT